MHEQVKKNLAEIRATKYTERFLGATEGLPAHVAKELEKDLDEIKAGLHKLDASRAILVPIYEAILSALEGFKSVMAEQDGARDITLTKRLEENFAEVVRAVPALTNMNCK
jgi:hypothetical protein